MHKDCRTAFPITATLSHQSPKAKKKVRSMQEPPVWVQFVPLALLALTLAYPFSRILRRAGYSGWLALIILVPFVAFIGIWVFAFARWPALDNKASAAFE